MSKENRKKKDADCTTMSIKCLWKICKFTFLLKSLTQDLLKKSIETSPYMLFQGILGHSKPTFLLNCEAQGDWRHSETGWIAEDCCDQWQNVLPDASHCQCTPGIALGSTLLHVFTNNPEDGTDHTLSKPFKGTSVGWRNGQTRVS